MAPAMNVKINGSIAALLQLVATVAFLAGTWPVEVKSGGISFKLDANAMDITFGAGGASGSDTAVVGFVFSIIASLLCFVGVIFGFKGKFKIAKGGFGFALIFNCLYYIALAEVKSGAVAVSPQWWWGAGCNIGAFINIVFALVFAGKAEKAAESTHPTGAPPAGIEPVA